MALDFFKPVSNISPFTYRDGETYLEQLKRLRNWIDELALLTNANFTDVIAQFDAGVAAAGADTAAALAAAQAAAQSAADAAETLANQTATQDDAVANLVPLGGETTQALDAAYSPLPGSLLGRFIKRCQADQPVTIVAVGDSILQGTTVSADGGVLGTDDCLSLVGAQVASRFGNSVTTVNEALSGHTVAMGPLSSKWNDAISDDGDLYLVMYGTNDISADITTNIVPGYNLDASIAGLERLFRRIRTDVPKADIAYVTANPYTGGTNASNNVAKRAYNRRVLDVAAAYGVEVIDGYNAFINEGADYDTFMSDSTHPNSLGHALLAETVMEHLPLKFKGGGRATSPVSVKGLFKPENVNVALGDTGVQSILIPTAPMWIETGSWTGDSSSVPYDNGPYRVSNTIGDKISGTGNFSELYMNFSTLTADNLRGTLLINGVAQFTNESLSLGKQGAYWVPLVTGLAPGVKTYEFIITGGIARIDRIGWLNDSSSGDLTPNIVFQNLGSGVTFTTVDATVVKLIDSNVVLPAGWKTADVTFRGYVNHRVTGQTTSIRKFLVNVRLNGTILDSQDFTVAPVAENSFTPPVSLSTVKGTINATRPITLETRVQSPTATLCGASSWAMEAMLIRRT